MRLKINKINFSYTEEEILSNISYEFDSGKIYCLIGNNGVGKTTLFNVISKILKYEGKILLDDQELDINKICYIRSKPSTPDFMTGEEYLKYFIKLHHIDTHTTVDDYFKQIKLKPADKHKLLQDYSDGMKNKIELLVNILMDPKVILLDEPFVNLDLVAREEFKDILNTLKANKIIILSTHSVELCLSLGDEIVLLNNKKLRHVDKDKKIIIEKMNERDA